MLHSKRSKHKPKNSWQFETFGTSWEIVTPAAPLGTSVKQSITRYLDVFDKTYSRFRPDSLVSRLHQPGTYIFPEDFSELYRLYLRLYELTDGKMTPLIGQALEEAGYDPIYTLRESPLTIVPSFDEVIRWDGDRTVTVVAPVIFDVGAIGKGYAVDGIKQILVDNGIEGFVIDASGDVYCRGAAGERIGLEDPRDTSKVVGIVDIKNHALCGSASNRRQWGSWHHIIDPHTRQPVRDILATWVVAEDTAVADGLATALFFIKDATVLRGDFSFEYVRMWSDGTVDYSPGFGGELFI